MKDPIYIPKGAAKEYGDYAMKIYTGCPHRCFYCFVPRVLLMDKEIFHTVVEPRKDIVEQTKKQLEREDFSGKTVHLCFTCDPYPTGYDTTPTREIIKLLKAHGAHVQILTKGDGSRDFDLLDEHDWYGVALDGSEKITFEQSPDKWLSLCAAMTEPCKTWVSFEPVVNASGVLQMIEAVGGPGGVDNVKIGKLNYYPSEINWKQFGHEAEALCQKLGLNYYIKDSLRREMEK